MSDPEQEGELLLHLHYLGDRWRRPGPELYPVALSPDAIVVLRRMAMVQEASPHTHNHDN